MKAYRLEVMDYEKIIINSIEKLSGSLSPYRIFTDWVSMMAISISNTCRPLKDKIYMEREEMYLNVSKKYNKEEFKILADMTAALALCLEDKMCDVLGDIYMKSGCGSKQTGQFFTPYHLSYLAASLVYGERIDKLAKAKTLEVNEPSTGGGGMLIAIADVMKSQGVNYQKHLHVVAQDLDWNGVYMTYVQLSLLGIRAIVVQGNTLLEPYLKGYDEGRVFRTPAEMGVIF